MAAGKKVVKVIKLQVVAGKANPGRPIGPALASAGVNIMNFCKDFNAKTQSMGGKIIPVEISVYKDKSFDFIMKEPPVAQSLLEVVKAEKGSSVPNRDKIGSITEDQVKQIAEKKMADLRVNSLEAAMKTVMGTARSMGIDIVGKV